MSFSFYLTYKPGWQKRQGRCGICREMILAGSKVVVGTGWFHKRLVSVHAHFGCYQEAIKSYGEKWYLEHGYIPTARPIEDKMELNRLMAKRNYLKKVKGVDKKDEIVMEVERKIKMVRSKKEKNEVL